MPCFRNYFRINHGLKGKSYRFITFTIVSFFYICFILLPFISLLNSCQSIKREDVDDDPNKELNGRTILCEIGWIENEDPLSVLSNNLIKAQSMVIMGNYVFNFLDQGRCLIMSRMDYSIVGVYSIPWASTWHFNNVQITPYYYSESDAYPILLLSDGGERKTGTPAKCAFARLRWDVNTFDLEEIKEINAQTPFSNHIGTFVANWDSLTLWLYCFEKVYTEHDNPIWFYEFSLPEWSDSSSVSYVESDVRRATRIPTNKPYLQSADYTNGRIVLGTRTTILNGKMVPDEKVKMLLYFNTVTMDIDCFVATQGYEVEGVCINENKVFVSKRNGGIIHEDGDIIFRIESFDLRK